MYNVLVRRGIPGHQRCEQDFERFGREGIDLFFGEIEAVIELRGLVFEPYERTVVVMTI